MTASSWVRNRRRTAQSIVAVVLAVAVPGPVAVATTGASAVSASDVALITIGQTATITVHGQVHNLGRLGGVMQSVHSTLSGDLVVADNMLKLISSAGKVTVLSGTATVDGFAVSPNGRYVAWSVQPGSYRAKEIYKLYLYDLQRRALVHSRLLTQQGQPVGFLEDGRVAVQGASGPSYLWTPGTGVLAKVGAPHLASVDQASGHLLVLSPDTDGCSGMVKDTRTGKGVVIPDDGRGCQFLEGLSPDGTRWWSANLSGVDGRLVVVPGIAAADSGKPDTQLSRLFFHERMSMTDGTWLDSQHLLVIAQRYKPGARIGRQLQVLCAIPVVAAPTCSTLKDLGPYERPEPDTNDPYIGPDVWLAHPLRQ